MRHFRFVHSIAFSHSLGICRFVDYIVLLCDNHSAMKYWPALVSAIVALGVGVGVVHELAPGLAFWRSTTARAERSHDTAQVGSSAVLVAVEPSRMFLGDTKATAPAGPGYMAELTVDPRMQKLADTALRSRRVSAGLVLLLELESGGLVTYASKQASNASADPITSATQPAADLMKLVTAGVLVQAYGLDAASPVCYRDPGKKLELQDLVVDAEADRWCPSLAESLGRNLDAPLARIAHQRLMAADWTKAARGFGFSQPVPFDLPVTPSALPAFSSDWEWIETAAGIQQGADSGPTLSGIHALMIASTVANQGVMLQPRLVNKVTGPDGKVVYGTAQKAKAFRKVMTPAAAAELGKMMFETVEIGDAFRSFHDDTGHPMLSQVQVAAKTGADRVGTGAFQTTWLIGFAPVTNPRVVFATMAYNRVGASGNAQSLAVDVLRGYFD